MRFAPKQKITVEIGDELRVYSAHITTADPAFDGPSTVTLYTSILTDPDLARARVRAVSPRVAEPPRLLEHGTRGAHRLLDVDGTPFPYSDSARPALLGCAASIVGAMS
jgi:hypothetical protein